MLVLFVVGALVSMSYFVKLIFDLVKIVHNVRYSDCPKCIEYGAVYSTLIDTDMSIWHVHMDTNSNKLEGTIGVSDFLESYVPKSNNKCWKNYQFFTVVSNDAIDHYYWKELLGRIYQR